MILDFTIIKKDLKATSSMTNALELLNYIKKENKLNQIFIVTNKPFLLSKKSIYFLKK